MKKFIDFGSSEYQIPNDRNYFNCLLVFYIFLWIYCCSVKILNFRGLSSSTYYSSLLKGSSSRVPLNINRRFIAQRISLNVFLNCLPPTSSLFSIYELMNTSNDSHNKHLKHRCTTMVSQISF